MDFNIATMENLLSELKCTKCAKLLSVFPIYTSSSVGNVCGRCTESIKSMISNNSIERHTPYESIAKYVIFPCSNREFGCETNLKYDEVVNHEKCCTYQPYKCPFNFDGCDGILQCDWKGAITNLSAHLDVTHATREINNPHTFMLNKDETDVKVHFAKFELLTFIIVTSYDSKTYKFYCSVMCYGDEDICNKYAYRIEVNKEDFYMIYTNSNVEPLIETSTVLQKDSNMMEIDVRAAVASFSSFGSDVNWKIAIIKKTNKSAEPASTPEEQLNNQPATSIPKEVPNRSVIEQKLLESNKLILKLLECPICRNSMKPPIYVCRKGHSICNKCNSKVKKCPLRLCRVKAIHGRNYALEKLTCKLLYPCKYSNDGCTEMLNVDVITKHENTCILKTDCPLIRFPISCNIKKGILNSISHIYESHSNDKFNPNEICKVTLRTTMYNYKVTIKDNEIFIVCYRYAPYSSDLKFNLLHFGMETNVPMYRYTLEFVINNQFATQLVVKSVCQKVPLDIKYALDLNCLSTPRHPLESCIDDNLVLQFMFKIEKI